MRKWRPGEQGKYKEEFQELVQEGATEKEAKQQAQLQAQVRFWLVKEALEAKEPQGKLQQKEEQRQKANAVVTIGVKSLVQIFMKRGLTSMKSKL